MHAQNNVFKPEAIRGSVAALKGTQSWPIWMSRKGYLRQPEDTPKNPTIESLPEHKHITQRHGQCCIFYNTNFVYHYRSSVCVPFLFWDQVEFQQIQLYLIL